MILPLLLSLTAQAEPWLDAEVGARAGLTEPAPGGLALGLGAGVGLTGPLRAELRATGLVQAQGGASLEAGPNLRLFLVDPEPDDRWRPSLHLGAGYALGQSEGLRVGGGFDLDLPGSPTSRTRLGIGILGDGADLWQAQVQIGVVGRPWRKTAEPVVVEPVEEPQVSIDPPRRVRWWDPESCEWLDDGDSDGGYFEGMTSLTPGGKGDGGAGEADEAQGWLMVVANPGDVVRVGGLEQTVGADGVARMRAPEGVVDVTIVGGGREQQIEAAIADAYALWLRARAPEEVRVGFASGSSTVRDEDRVLLQALTRNRGHYILQVSGSYSPDGSLDANLRLAQARAAAVVDLLKQAGIPEDELRIVPPTPPRPGLSAAEQRSVYVQPVSTEESR